MAGPGGGGEDVEFRVFRFRAQSQSKFSVSALATLFPRPRRLSTPDILLLSKETYFWAIDNNVHWMEEQEPVIHPPQLTV